MIQNLKSIAEIDLAGYLLKLYIAKEFENIDKKIKYWLKFELPPILKIESYLIYQELVEIEFDKFEYIYLSSLKSLNDNELLTRAKLDATILVNLPSNILVSLDNIKKNLKKNKSTEPTEEDYEIALVLLFPSLNIMGRDGTTYSNNEIKKITDKNFLQSSDAKKKFKEYKKKINNNKEDIKKIEEIEKEYNKKIITEATITSVVAKKVFLSESWRCSFLANSRESHKNANGSKRDIEGFFIVGGERFRYPGDWSYASVRNVINCRCYVS